MPVEHWLNIRTHLNVPYRFRGKVVPVNLRMHDFCKFSHRRSGPHQNAIPKRAAFIDATA